MREQIHHETVNPAEWLFCSDGLLPCFRDNETGIRNGPAFFQQARRAPLHGSPLQPACQTAGSPTGRPPRHPQRRSPTSRLPAASGAAPASQQPLTIGGAAPVRPDKRRTARQRDANPLHSNPRRPVTKWRANRHGSHPPGHHAPPSSRITRRNRRASAPSCINPPEPPRPRRPIAYPPGTAAPRRPQRCSPTHGNPRRPAAQPPLHGYPATGHEMAGKPTWQPPAGPPSPAPSCIIPRNRRAPPSPCITRRAAAPLRPLA